MSSQRAISLSTVEIVETVEMVETDDDERFALVWHTMALLLLL